VVGVRHTTGWWAALYGSAITHPKRNWEQIEPHIALPRSGVRGSVTIALVEGRSNIDDHRVDRTSGKQTFDVVVIACEHLVTMTDA